MTASILPIQSNLPLLFHLLSTHPSAFGSWYGNENSSFYLLSDNINIRTIVQKLYILLWWPLDQLYLPHAELLEDIRLK